MWTLPDVRMLNRHAYAVLYLLTCALAFSDVRGAGKEDETVVIRGHSIYEGFGKYQASRIKACAQRIPVRAISRVDSLFFWVAGDSGATCVVRILGDEGQGSIPQIMADRCNPVPVMKIRNGVERCSVIIPHMNFDDVDQVFVVFDSLRDVSILTGKTRIADTCECPTEVFGHQCLQGIDGRWRTGPLDFLVDTWLTLRPAKSDLAFIPDTLVYHHDAIRSLNDYLVFDDINGDGRPDILSPQGFLVQHGNEQYDLVKGSDSIAGAIAAIVPLPAMHTDMKTRLAIITKQSVPDSTIQRMTSIVSSMEVIAEFIDLGGAKDLVASGYIYDQETEVFTIVTISNYDNVGIVEGTSISRDGSKRLFRDQRQKFNSAHVTDIDGDGRIDVVAALVVDSTHTQSQILYAVGTEGVRTQTLGLSYTTPIVAPPQFSHGALINHSKAPSILLAESPSNDGFRSLEVVNHGYEQSVISVNAEDLTNSDISGLHIGYRDRIARIAFRDLNNDGYDDIMILTGDTCRGLALYEQSGVAHSSWKRNRSTGMELLSGCSGIAWNDMNGDGLADAVGYRNGVLLLMKNTSKSAAPPVAERQHPNARHLSFGRKLVHDELGTAIHYRSGVRGHSKNIYDQVVLDPVAERVDQATLTAQGQTSQIQLRIKNNVVRDAIEFILTGSDFKVVVHSLEIYDMQGSLLAALQVPRGSSIYRYSLSELGAAELASGAYRLIIVTNLGIFSEPFIKVQ